MPHYFLSGVPLCGFGFVLKSGLMPRCIVCSIQRPFIANALTFLQQHKVFCAHLTAKTIVLAYLQSLVRTQMKLPLLV